MLRNERNENYFLYKRKEGQLKKWNKPKDNTFFNNGYFSRIRSTYISN